jgi:drug/metabolite transporter (DMT)-like permease
MNRRTEGVLLILCSASSFACLAIFARFAYQAGIEPMTVLFLRFTLATGMMLLLALGRRCKLPDRKTVIQLAAMGGIGYVGQSICFFGALTMASAGLVELLLYLYPPLVTILSVIFLRERLTATKLVALTVALAGLVLTIWPLGGGRPLGILLGIASAVIYAVYIIVGSRVTRGVDPIMASTIIIASAAVVYGVIAGLRGIVLPRTAAGWESVTGLALVATVLAIVTFFAGLERLGPVDTAMLATVEPPVTLVLAAVLLGESFGTLRLVGGAMILAAVLVLARIHPDPVVVSE